MRAPLVAPERTSVTVLLSTRDCAASIDAQVASILNQTCAGVRLIVRDERSTDGTWERLRAWRENARFLAIRASHAAPRVRPLHMLGLIDRRCGAVAFAQQADVWRPDRIERAVRSLAATRKGRPALYFNRAATADVDGRLTGATPLWPRTPEFGNALVESVATLGAIVLNREAALVLKDAGLPHGAADDAWWCYLVVSAFGDVIYDPNVSVASRRRPPRVQAPPPAEPKDDAFLSKIVGQARAFLRHFGTHPALGDRERGLLSALAYGSQLERRVLAAESRVWRQFVADDWMVRARLLTGQWPQRRPLLAYGPAPQRVSYMPE